MRALILAKAKLPPPAEAMPMLVQGFIDWRERYRGQMETFEFFASGNGGYGVVNMDEATLFGMMVSWPFAPFSDIEIHALVEGDKALGMFLEIIQQMGG